MECSLRWAESDYMLRSRQCLAWSLKRANMPRHSKFGHETPKGAHAQDRLKAGMKPREGKHAQDISNSDMEPQETTMLRIFKNLA